MRNFLRLCSIVSIIIAAVKIGVAGLLTPAWVTFLIVCAVLFLAGGRRVLIITAAVASVAIFATIYAIS